MDVIMPRGYWTTDAYKEVPPIQDLTWQTINSNSQSKPQPWYCTKCQKITSTGTAATNDVAKMQLMPTNRDIPATHWKCSRCKRQISLEERDTTFEDKRKDLQHLYKLRLFNYNRQSDTWTIQSAEWEGEDRLQSKRKRVTESLRRNIGVELKYELSDALGIHFETWKEFFLDGN
jgi:hypothetical protein